MTTNETDTNAVCTDGTEQIVGLDDDAPYGTPNGRKQNRVATKSHLHELGFIGVNLKMVARDYALIDLSDVPRKRRMVAEVYFENTDPYHREPHVDGYEWGVEI